jgi:nitrate reductase beta subunit
MYAFRAINLFDLNPNDTVIFSNGEERKIKKIHVDNEQKVYYFDIEFDKAIKLHPESRTKSKSNLFYIDGKYIEDQNNDCNNIVSILPCSSNQKITSKYANYSKEELILQIENLLRSTKKLASN